MKLSTSLNNFKKIHKKRNNQTIYFSENCKDYNFIENLYKFILMQKNSFIFESVEKGKIRGRYTIIGFNPDKIFNIGNNVPVKLLDFISTLEEELGLKAIKIMKPIITI